MHFLFLSNDFPLCWNGPDPNKEPCPLFLSASLWYWKIATERYNPVCPSSLLTALICPCWQTLFGPVQCSFPTAAPHICSSCSLYLVNGDMLLTCSAQHWWITPHPAHLECSWGVPAFSLPCHCLCLFLLSLCILVLPPTHTHT